VFVIVYVVAVNIVDVVFAVVDIFVFVFVVFTGADNNNPLKLKYQPNIFVF
jgi:hypothetical protein